MMNAQKLSIKIENIRNNNGQIQIAVFENEEQFKSESPVSKQYFKKRVNRDGSQVIEIDLDPGTYGITVLDDEDMSTEMTFKLGIYPKEGVGFSDYYLQGMTKPKFDQFSFDVKDNSANSVNVKIKYF